MSTGKRAQNEKWSFGVLNDNTIFRVPGSVQLLASQNKAPHQPSGSSSRHSVSSTATETQETSYTQRADDKTSKKLSKDGQIILEPQPTDSPNDPLNWPAWRRNLVLLSVGLFSMLGGGITPLIAAGFTDVGKEYDVEVETVALTTGFTMMGLGVGAVIVTPTAILFGKRIVYLVTGVLVIGTSLWAAWSPTFNSLLAARVFQGMSASSIECLPSATIAEIFFLHERAYRLGIYTLLLLGGRNLIPLVSAAVMNSLGWRWAFWIIAMAVGFAVGLIFLFAPESFWDRKTPHESASNVETGRISSTTVENQLESALASDLFKPPKKLSKAVNRRNSSKESPFPSGDNTPSAEDGIQATLDSNTVENNNNNNGYSSGVNTDMEKAQSPSSEDDQAASPTLEYSRKSFRQLLQPYHGRLSNDNFFNVMFRPFILFAYPAILWSAIVYACSIGWLIVISETVAIIYRDEDRYGFSALSTGLIYISPFLGGVIGSAVAGKVSDFVVRLMAARNNGLYEPEFRLVMAFPVLVATCAGLMGYGWSAAEKNHWIVPTIFFGTISFGCSLGSTTSINYALDSYGQFSGEALVTLNFSKNIFHGLVFSLFVTKWMAADGPKQVFVWVGIIQLIVMLLTIPMYIFGKRARAWTYNRNLMKNF